MDYHERVEGGFVESGQITMFEDFENEGPMWSGDGERRAKKFVEFRRPFISRPIIHLAVNLMDVRTDSMIRYELDSEQVTNESFDLIFKTWGDSKFARVRVAWMAIGTSIRDEFWLDF